jgi:DNA-binding NtrC family response regulator
VTPLFTSRNRDTSRLAATLARLAPTGLSLLVEGETGTGKSFVARAIHRRSRSGRPLVVVDCGAVPESLLAAELFGHRAGAFTDATRARRGWLERAADGTVILDRLDALTAAAQVTLLRVLEERVFYPVGTATPRRFAARVVACVAPGAAGDAGPLRSDLYHRVAGYHATLPPLRRRPEDVLPFAGSVLRRLAGRGGANRLDAEAAALLAAYPWPGNFRELATTVERAALAAAGRPIGAADLGLPSRSWPEVAATAAERGMPLREATRLYGLLVLAQHGGNVSAAARALGVSRRTLIRWRAER